MSAPYSHDLRQKAIEAVKRGERKIDVCRMLYISRNGIDKHWMLILEGIADAAPSSDELMDALLQQALDPSECGIIRIGA